MNVSVRLAALLSASLLLLASRAAADPTTIVPPPPINLHFSSNTSVRTDTQPDVELRLPPGYYLDEDTWNKLDVEVKRLQEQEIRLAAENKSLRASASGWYPGWRFVAAALVVGIGVGAY